MEDKKLSELQSTAKEWVQATGKAFHQIDKELGLKGRIAVLFGIVIIWLLGAILAHVDQRDYSSFDRNGRGFMMQERADSRFSQDDMFDHMRNAMDRDFGMMGNRPSLEGCAQQTTVQVDPQNPNIQVIESHANCPFADQEVAAQDKQSDSIFNRMGNRMRQLFRSDDTPTPSTGTVN